MFSLVAICAEHTIIKYLLFSPKCPTWRPGCSKCEFNFFCAFLDSTSHQPAKWYHHEVHCQYNWSRDSQLDCAHLNKYIPTGTIFTPILHLWMCGQCIYCWQWTIQWGVDRNNYRRWYVTLDLLYPITNSKKSSLFSALSLLSYELPIPLSFSIIMYMLSCISW